MKQDKKWKAAIINLGCKVNKYEADAMTEKLSAEGFIMVEPEEIADFYIVNTCSVTNMAQKKSRQMLRRAKRMNPDAVIVAAGCYVNAEYDALQGEDFVDILVSNNCKKDIASILLAYVEQESFEDYYIDINRTTEYEEMGHLTAEHMDHQRAYIKIQDGCNQFCSYCIIPYTRGRVRSREACHILDEIRQLASEGVKEFVLTGIHISSYGIDLRRKDAEYDDVMEMKQSSMAEPEENITDLGALVCAISHIPEVQRIRLGSLEPRIVTEEFLKGLKENEKFCPHFHLSLQSACNATLARMNRKYKFEDFAKSCERIRQYFDRPAITTDVIVGFPGETEEEFEETYANLVRLNLYEIHVFKYSVRERTVAAKLPNQISEQIKGERSERILALTAAQKKEYEKSLSDFVDEVLIEEELVSEEQENDCVEVLTEKQENEADNTLQSKELSRIYTGHTKRYVKVKLKAQDNIVNRVIKVRYR